MAFTELYAQTTGSNLNAGSTTADAASLTYASGNWVAGTGVFTVASGDPSSDGVAVGDFVSVYPDGATVAVFVGRVTARDTTTITVSLTAKSGTAPTDGTGDRTLKVGGAWKGPNAAEGFPFGFVQGTQVNSSSNPPRVNFKNGTNYSITAALSHSATGPITFQGYTSSVGDGGRFTIDGGTSGASYVLLTVSSTYTFLVDCICQNNGATGTADGINGSGSWTMCVRCVAHDVRGDGFSAGNYLECEAYNCGQGGASVGFKAPITAQFCIAHDNTGRGFEGPTGSGAFMWCSNCIADTNTTDGFILSGRQSTHFAINCDAYNNSGDGFELSTGSVSPGACVINCNAVKNGGYGINRTDSSTLNSNFIANCGFGSGTMANTSGETNFAAASMLLMSGNVTYASNVTPWVDPANGDFRINLAAAKGAGRGAFTQTAASYAGAVGYPDIGAAQHVDSGSGGGGPLIGGRLINA